MTARPSRSRGSSLLELLVASTVVLLVIGTATMGFLSQNQALQAADLTRVASESIRDATLQLEGSLRQAGWGVDPRFAIDMVSGCPVGGPCRDRFDAPDELVFVSRSPLYRWQDFDGAACATPGGCFSGNAWPIEAVNLAGAPRTVSVTLANGQVLERGRIVLAACAGGLNAVMLTLSTAYTGNGGLVELVPEAASAVPYNDHASLQGCHAVAGAALFLVDRSRYFVTTIAGTPWLMLDTGLDLDDDGALPPGDTDDLVPLARNVEDMQVAYLLQPNPAFAAPDSNADWIIGNNRAAGAPEEPNRGATAPLYNTPAGAAARFTLHPANVRAVRVTLTLRSTRTDPRHGPGWAGETVQGAENRTGNLAGGGFRRFVARTEITLRNMESRGPFTF